MRDVLRYQKSNGVNITTSTPDSIHLATARRAGCDFFVTLDGRADTENRRSRERDRKLLDLIQVPGDSKIIPIVRPSRFLPDQMQIGEDSMESISTRIDS